LYLEPELTEPIGGIVSRVRLVAPAGRPAWSSTMARDLHGRAHSRRGGRTDPLSVAATRPIGNLIKQKDSDGAQLRRLP
jgi:hypothetical protein